MHVYINTIGLYLDPTFGKLVAFILRNDYCFYYEDGLLPSKFKIGDKELFTMFQLKYGKYITKIIP